MVLDAKWKERMARAAATDAGNASMSADGRREWKTDDFTVALEEYTRVKKAYEEVA